MLVRSTSSSAAGVSAVDRDRGGHGGHGVHRHQPRLVFHHQPYRLGRVERAFHVLSPLRWIRIPGYGCPHGSPRTLGRAALEGADDVAVDREALSRGAVLDAGLQAFAEPERDAGGQVALGLGRTSRFVGHIDQVDAIAHHPTSSRPSGSSADDVGRHPGEEVEQATRKRAGQHGADPLGHRGHRLVAQLAHRGHVGPYGVHRQ